MAINNNIDADTMSRFLEGKCTVEEETDILNDTDFDRESIEEMIQMLRGVGLEGETPVEELSRRRAKAFVDETLNSDRKSLFQKLKDAFTTHGRFIGWSMTSLAVACCAVAVVFIFKSGKQAVGESYVAKSYRVSEPKENIHAANGTFYKTFELLVPKQNQTEVKAVSGSFLYTFKWRPEGVDYCILTLKDTSGDILLQRSVENDSTSILLNKYPDTILWNITACFHDGTTAMKDGIIQIK